MNRKLMNMWKHKAISIAKGLQSIARQKREYAIYQII